MGFKVDLIFDLDFIELRVTAIGVMMKHDQGAHFGIGCQLAHLRQQRMSPAVFVRHVVLGVLRIVNQHVDAVQVVNPLVVVGAGGIGWIEFIVGDIGEARTVFVNLVSRSTPGMIECLPDYLDALALVELAFNALELGENVRRQVFGACTGK